MGLGTLIKKGMTGLGLMADEDAGKQSRQQAMDMQREMIAKMEAVGLPEYDKMAKLFADMEPAEFIQKLEDIGPSAMEDIIADPEAAMAQKDTLREMQELAKTGYSEEDRAKMEEFRRVASGDENARQQSIMQNMAARGTLGSGSELAAKLSSSQGAADRANRASVQMAGDAAAARRGALAESGRFAGNMRSQDFGEQASKARAKDSIAQFNSANRQAYERARQQNENQRASLSQQKAKLAAGLEQQKFSDAMAKTGGVTQQMQGLANSYGAQAGAEASSAQQNAAAMRGMVIEGGKAAFGGAQDGGVARRVAGNNQVQMNKFQNDYTLDSGTSTYGVQAADGTVKYADGGMAYNDGGEGTIIPGESYAGDELKDNINSGEMVLNVDQQERVNKMYREYAKLKSARSGKRTDEQLDDGEKLVNSTQQEALMAVVRGEISPEELPDEDILSEGEENELAELLGMK